MSSSVADIAIRVIITNIIIIIPFIVHMLLGAWFQVPTVNVHISALVACKADIHAYIYCVLI